MCGLCGAFGVEHWAEEGGRRARLQRLELLRRVLAQFGLEVDEWSGTMYVLRDRKGSTEVVTTLGVLWPAAERLTGRPLDPLEPALVEALGG